MPELLIQIDYPHEIGFAEQILRMQKKIVKIAFLNECGNEDK